MTPTSKDFEDAIKCFTKENREVAKKIIDDMSKDELTQLMKQPHLSRKFMVRKLELIDEWADKLVEDIYGERNDI